MEKDVSGHNYVHFFIFIFFLFFFLFFQAAVADTLSRKNIYCL